MALEKQQGLNCWRARFFSRKYQSLLRISLKWQYFLNWFELRWLKRANYHTLPELSEYHWQGVFCMRRAWKSNLFWSFSANRYMYVFSISSLTTTNSLFWPDLNYLSLIKAWYLICQFCTYEFLRTIRPSIHLLFPRINFQKLVHIL